MNNKEFIDFRWARVWWWMGAGWVGLVIFLSLAPVDAPLPEVLPWRDKVGHLLAYAVLMLWFAQLYPVTRYGRVALAFLAMGVVLEGVQGILPYRFFDLMDIRANGLGVLCGWVVARMGAGRWVCFLEQRFSQAG